ncbi:M20 family metallopeptidase [Planosporangium mesophilum]|uniref:Peptidase M20 n=1 Tax=Planosporangium mesophilum TaxID=689768 RepID=A0A8J3TML0_9ACTN|nr:M20 family metallopeptidase [Planosporangium mesophilum]NJC85414.1 M20 family metallopeptidase [Planosporangium mesophilum]GII24075.1 peptidase M20 [Planosporangium mesophilum]
MTPTRALLDWVAAHRGEMLADLARYVEIETPSNDKDCLTDGLSWLASWVPERLGEPAAVEQFDGGEHGDIRVYDYPGAGGLPVLMLCHYDTVWDKGTLRDWPFDVDGDRATGPGIFDMKSGLVHAVWALRALSAAGLPRPPVRLLLNGDEEIGSPASRPVIEAAAADTRAALVFEASADGAIKTARKGVGIYRVTAHGIEAHAGLDPMKGASAVDELARAVLALHALTDLDAGTTVNVGVIHGGTRTNVTAGSAYGDIDVRVSSAAEAARVDAALAALRAHDPRATVTVDGGWNRPVMERTELTGRLFLLAKKLAAGIGVTLDECSVGGASDGNFVAALGVPVLDGFGAVGDGAHARHEHISVQGMVERTALAAAVLHALAP